MKTQVDNYTRLLNARMTIAQGERLARLALKDILAPYGYQGLEVCCSEEYRGVDYEPMTEMSPGDHQYIERLRAVNNGWDVEMMVEGEWYGLEGTDLHFLLDVVEQIVFNR